MTNTDNRINFDQTGTVFDIQRYSLHDGPGIRTIVFMKGCPMVCPWCSNPESQRFAPGIMFEKSSCTNCQRCHSACKHGALNSTGLDFDKCVGCGECVGICPTGSLTLSGKVMQITDIMKELKKDAITYRRSSGGITLSGGEPMVQPVFAAELLKACKAQGWHTAIETVGLGSDEDLVNVFSYVDLALLDIKTIDPHLHEKYIGIPNAKLLENAVKISNITKVAVRVPVIPNFNSSSRSIEQICEFAKTLNDVDTIHLLPYHRYGENKYDLLGMEYTMPNKAALSQEDMEALAGIVQSYGFSCVIGG